MSGQDVSTAVLALLLAGALGGLTPLMRRLWRGDPELALRLRRLFVNSTEELREARVRGAVALFLAIDILLAATLLLTLGMRDGGAVVWTVAGGVLFAVGLAVFALQVTIAWLGRPRFLIPPPMRGEPSMAERRRTAG